MAEQWLNQAANAQGGLLYTASRQDTDGKPITDTKLYAEDENGNKVPLKVDASGNVLTQLTGSNVKLMDSVDIVVPAGGFTNVSDKITTNTFKEINIGVYGVSTTSFDVHYYAYGEADTSYNPIFNLQGSAEGSATVSLIGLPSFHSCRARIYNNDSADKTFRVEMRGVR